MSSQKYQALILALPMAVTAISPVPTPAVDEEEEGGTPIYDLTHHRWGNPEIFISSAMLIFMLLLFLSFVASYYVSHVMRCTLFPEAAVVLTIGVIAGGLATIGEADEISEDITYFSPTVFFVGLLPPIIFNSGYHLQKRHFFANFGAIGAYAIVGTAFSALIIGTGLWVISKWQWLSPHGLDFSECLTFGALISATDPVSVLAVFAELQVDPNLFYLVFGESVINDAVGVVLFNTVAKFVGNPGGVDTCLIAVADFFVIFLGSLIIGYVVGILFAFVFKNLHFHEQTMIEVCSYTLLIYIPYLIAESLEMSGIVATLFAGISVKHYVASNLTIESQQKAKFLVRMMAYVTETTVFLNLGLSVFALHYWSAYHTSLIVWSLIFCLVARAMHIYPLSWLINRNRRNVDTQITMNKQHMLWFSGLRGAVAFACAQVFPNANGHRDVFLVTTMLLVLITVFTMGCGTVPMLNKLGIRTGVDEDEFPSAPPFACTLYMLKLDQDYIVPRVTKEGHRNGYDLQGGDLEEEEPMKHGRKGSKHKLLEMEMNSPGADDYDERNGNYEVPPGAPPDSPLAEPSHLSRDESGLYDYGGPGDMSGEGGGGGGERRGSQAGPVMSATQWSEPGHAGESVFDAGAGL